jgi:hypothetical protein
LSACAGHRATQPLAVCFSPVSRESNLSM